MGEVGCLKDGNFQNLQVDNTILNSMVYKRPVVNVATTPFYPSVSQSGTIFSINRANGISITLPTAEAGLVYEFYVETPFTGPHVLRIAAAGAGDQLRGLIKMSPTGFFDGNDATTSERGHCGPTTTDHQFVADNDTKGRLAGTHLVFKCISDTVADTAAGRWSISGHAITSGDITTPFT
jgi:hypothetical protein